MTSADRPPVEVVEVEVADAEVDLVSGLLWGAGATAVAEHRAGRGRTRLVAGAPTERLADLAAAASVASGGGVRVMTVADDGLDGWRAHAGASRAGHRVVVHPPWVSVDSRPGDVVVTIDPGRAFGHGGHPTTRLVLTATERLVKPGDRVLDAGSGSGVLAIAAVLLGAARARAVDTDPEALRATGANARANHVADRIAVDATPIDAVAGRFDLVLANLDAPTLLRYGPALAGRVAPGGSLVVSGMLADRSGAVAAALAPLTVVGRTEDDGWAALVIS